MPIRVEIGTHVGFGIRREDSFGDWAVSPRTSSSGSQVHEERFLGSEFFSERLVSIKCGEDLGNQS